MFSVWRRVRVRLAVVALVPGLTLSVLGVTVSAGLVGDGVQIREWSEDLARIRPAASELLAAVAAERLLSVQKLARGTAVSPDLGAARDRVDAGFARLLRADRLRHRPAPAIAEFWTAFAPKLAHARQGIDTGRLSAAHAAAVFDAPMALFDAGFREAQRRAPDPLLAARVAESRRLIDAAVALTKAATVGVGLSESGGAAFTADDLVHQVGHYRTALTGLAAELSGPARDRLAALLAGSAWRALAEREDALLGEAVTGSVAGGRDWRPVFGEVLTGLLNVYAAQHDSVQDDADRAADREIRTGLLAATIVLALASGSTGLALSIGARLGRRVRRLRDRTLDVAEVGLPAVLRAAEDGDPATVVPRAQAPLDLGRDEIGEVAVAFEHAAAAVVEAVVAQVDLRRGTRAVFADLAGRSQALAHRQLAVLDEAERHQQDPELLDLFFRLDHLATRGRRNAENLLVLAGVRPGRAWRGPVALVDVVRGAVAESTEFARVRLARVAEVAVSGAAVTDLAHLLAELIDNAAAFSPAGTRIEVGGTTADGGAVVSVGDQGIGMDVDQLRAWNELLSTAPAFDLDALVRDSRFGLFVVARLAAEHGLTVRLGDSDYGGVCAEVRIPATLLADAAIRAPDVAR
ncbi:sensor histidine kinase [Nocardia thailandica]|uniref:sensor histidine kinase n=1 Tax=Nocardia thailandica TaxID=257275 RepID=UPI000694314C|nr:ATP-binding protein [Nocardia thailandica]